MERGSGFTGELRESLRRNSSSNRRSSNNLYNGGGETDAPTSGVEQAPSPVDAEGALGLGASQGFREQQVREAVLSNPDLEALPTTLDASTYMISDTINARDVSGGCG